VKEAEACKNQYDSSFLLIAFISKWFLSFTRFFLIKKLGRKEIGGTDLKYFVPTRSTTLSLFSASFLWKTTSHKNKFMF
jgi:hypothetical protein